ncbi:MAG: class II aldolase/adducin family protein [Verrucomicrobiae bacterium]|nr:class II aldolase/adducin family protein [Verrucomicrobiae bacterium]
MTREEKLAELLRLSHELGNPQRALAILGEGNTSARIDDKTFLVKASGTCLGTLREEDVVECRFESIRALLARKKLPDADVDAGLMAARVDPNARKPSVEALFHGYFLSLPEVEFVGHAHAPWVTGILCSRRAREFAKKRIFPDEIVCCDIESVFVPYTDPGLALAQAIAKATERFRQRRGCVPRVVLIQNHGIVTLGRTVDGVLAAMLMAEKAAQIWAIAAAIGGPHFMTPQQVGRISGRPDEAYRRKVLKV